MWSGHVGRPDDQRDSLIYTNRVSEEQLAQLDDLSVCPSLFQRLIEKRSDVRITVVDGVCHAVELIALDDGTNAATSGETTWLTSAIE